MSAEDRARLLRQLRGPTVAAPPQPVATAGPGRWPKARARLKGAANLDSIAFEEMEVTPPGPGQIQVRARAIALNFRDLMIAMGLYPPTPGVPSVMGSDYAGEVTACGEGVTQFTPGQRVMALSAGDAAPDGTVAEQSHFCTRPNISAAQAVAMPATLSFVEAASVPTVFLTAYLALEHYARLAAGERVLIHSATGGVGLAAVEIARSRGAEILASAGSEAKRDYLRGLGIAQVYDSRSTAFADEIEGGLDVILNTLAGEAVARGLDLLRPFGRFLQIAKQDIANAGVLPLAPFNRGLSFTAIDLSLFLLSPATMTRLLGEIAERFASGAWRPTPTTCFAPERTGEALRLMSQYRHIGKIVIDYGSAG